MLKSELKYEAEPMDTGELLYDEYDEEGEIHSSGDEGKDNWKVKTAEDDSARTTSAFGRVSSDLSIHDKTDELKKLERAKRFAINVEDNKVPAVNNESLSRLHKTLGIDKDNERHYRFNAIHMRGTQDMSTEDVFEYFSFFAPAHVEWINDVSCNVVWTNDISAARALINLSREIKNLDKIRLNADPFEKDLKDQEENMECNEYIDAVDAREIKAAIPPGFWRIGAEAKKSPTILLRFATRTDRKQRNAEKNSEYYKRYGNPHFGNLPGLVSKSLRRGVFLKKRLQNNNEDSNEGSGKKNPWGHLAQEWNEMDKSPERAKSDIKSRITLKRPHPTQLEDLRMSINSKQRQKNVRFKQLSAGERSYSDDDNTRESKIKFPRMKMYADLEKKNGSSSKNRLSPQIRVVEDLRNKIDRRRKNKEIMSIKQGLGVSKRYWNKLTSQEEDLEEYDDDDDDDDDEEEEEEEEKGSNWALEQYSDLRESLEQKSRQSRISKQTRTANGSDSEDNESDDGSDVYNGHLGYRSPLQIEIENDEYFENESDNTV